MSQKLSTFAKSYTSRFSHAKITDWLNSTDTLVQRIKRKQGFLNAGKFLWQLMPLIWQILTHNNNATSIQLVAY